MNLNIRKIKNIYGKSRIPLFLYKWNKPFKYERHLVTSVIMLGQPYTSKSIRIWGKMRADYLEWFFVSLDSSYGFLSMIFGINGKFWIDIGVQKIFYRKIFRPKKIKQIVEFFGRKFGWYIASSWLYQSYQICSYFFPRSEWIR